MGGGDAGGGSRELARLIDRHGEYILADLLSEYGVNLIQVFQPGSGHSPRSLLALIRQLPAESRTVSAIRGGGQFLGWGADRYMTAALIDAVRENTYATVAANSKRKPKPPKPVERPKRTGQTRSGSTTAANPFAVMAAHHLKAAREAKGE